MLCLGSGNDVHESALSYLSSGLGVPPAFHTARCLRYNLSRGVLSHMTTSVIIETVQLPEIHDLEWPTDPALVTSYRKTLQQGGHFSPIRLNRVWLEDATWRYQIIDGFHRF